MEWLESINVGTRVATAIAWNQPYSTWLGSLEARGRDQFLRNVVNLSVHFCGTQLCNNYAKSCMFATWYLTVAGAKNLHIKRLSTQVVHRSGFYVPEKLSDGAPPRRHPLWRRLPHPASVRHPRSEIPPLSPERIPSRPIYRNPSKVRAQSLLPSASHSAF